MEGEHMVMDVIKFTVTIILISLACAIIGGGILALAFDFTIVGTIVTIVVFFFLAAALIVAAIHYASKSQ